MQHAINGCIQISELYMYVSMEESFQSKSKSLAKAVTFDSRALLAGVEFKTGIEYVMRSIFFDLTGIKIVK